MRFVALWSLYYSGNISKKAFSECLLSLDHLLISVLKQRHCSNKLTKSYPGSRDPHLQPKLKARCSAVCMAFAYVSGVHCRKPPKRSVHGLCFKLNLSFKNCSRYIFLPLFLMIFPPYNIIHNSPILIFSILTTDRRGWVFLHIFNSFLLFFKGNGLLDSLWVSKLL